MKKREPTLADRLISSSGVYLNRKADEAARQRLLISKRFVIDAEAARYIGEMVRRVPRIIADAQDFAIPPFEQMWVEFPYDVYFEAINGVPVGVAQSVSGMTGQLSADTNIGFLISGSHHVRVGVWGPRKGSSGGDAMFTPVEYLIHRPWTRQEELKFREDYSFSGMTLDHFFWGTSGHDLHLAGKHESIRALRAENSVRGIEPDISKKLDFSIVKDKMKIAMIEGSGDLRNIIAVLLFLNRTSDLQYVREVPTTQGFIGNHLKPFLSHHVITLKVDRDEVEKRIKYLIAGHGATKRLHDVRGHFCHNEKAKTAPCMHDWEETDWMPGVIVSGARVPRQWKCVRCTGLRWWKKEHERGHEEKGLVTSEYDVTKG